MIEWDKNDLIYLPFWLMCIAVISIVLRIYLKDKTIKVREIPLKIICLSMIILEIIKQIVSISNGYSLWHIPLHFCSVFLYVYPLMLFCKGKVKEFGKTMSFVSSAIVFAVYLCGPSRIIPKDGVINLFSDFFTFHSVVYHHLVILFLFIGVFLHLFELKKYDFKYVFLGLALYGIIAVPMAHILNVNFCDLLHNSFQPLQEIRLAIGNFGFYVFLFLIGSAGGLLVFFLHYTLSLLIKNYTNKKNQILYLC